jgi:uncharacterized protein (TIGR00369 family)
MKESTERKSGAADWRQLERLYQSAPIHRALGLSLTVVDVGVAEIHYNGSAEGHNRHGRTAGGTIASMVDSAVVQAARTMLPPDHGLVTLEMKINYIGATRGGELSCAGRIDHLGRSTAVGHARAVDENGRLIAIGIVTLRLQEPP